MANTKIQTFVQADQEWSSGVLFVLSLFKPVLGIDFEILSSPPSQGLIISNENETSIKVNKNYWHHIFAMPGVPVWVLILLTPIEILGIFLRPFVLMIRLFANITAGHIIALSFFSLIFIFGEMSTGLGWGVSVLSVAFVVFMTMLELLVAFLQAYVFTLLSAIYFGAAVEEHHHAHENEEDGTHAHVAEAAIV